MRPLATVAFLLLTFLLPGNSQVVPPFPSDSDRVDSLLKQMTLEDKLNLIRGDIEPAATDQGQAGYLPGVPRLGVPSLRMADGPPGVLTRVAGQAQTATMGVAATWSAKDAEQNGVAIGRQARSLGIDVVLQPFINLDRDITFARSYNTLGEDPFLSGVLGAAEIRGAQGQGVMAMAKHYIAYDSDSYNVFVDQQTLHEVYVAPFDAAIKAGVASIMCSYNRINGTFACGNPETLKTILRDELGFKGFVTSDWGGVHNVNFINAGLTMEMPGALAPESPFASLMRAYFRTRPETPGPPAKADPDALTGVLGGTIPEEANLVSMDIGAFPTDADPKTMRDALADGAVTEATVTEAARLVLMQMDRFGYLDGKQKHDVTPQDLEGNGTIIGKTAEDAAVLLKNEGGILPLKNAGSISMIGPTAGQVAAIGTFGERSPGIPARQAGPLDALRKLAPQAKVTFAVADDMTGTPVGAAAFGKGGLVRTDAAGKTSVDASIDFTGSRALAPNTVATWKGEITIPSDGEYWFYLQALGTRAHLSIDGKEVGRTGASKGAVHGDVQFATQDNELPTTDGLDNVRRAIQLTKGRHPIEVVTSMDTSNAPVELRLNWMTPGARQLAHNAAIKAARGAQTAVVFVWTRDKPHFELPGDQNQLVEEVAAANPNTVVVLNTSQPVVMPWIDKVKGVLEMWWPGDEGGAATARVLLGNANPGGHLPMTWGKALADYPATAPTHPERSAKGVDGKTTFSEGLLVGYRWFEDQNILPLYPFGFGLSYTSFAVSALQVSALPDGGVHASLHVKNTGRVAGDAVPQVYLDAPENKPEGVQFAPKTLVGFDRVSLQPGEEREVTLEIAPRAFEYWSVAQKAWVRANGSRTLRAGQSSQDLPLTATTQ